MDVSYVQSDPSVCTTWIAFIKSRRTFKFKRESTICPCTIQTFDLSGWFYIQACVVKKSGSQKVRSSQYSENNKTIILLRKCSVICRYGVTPWSLTFVLKKLLTDQHPSFFKLNSRLVVRISRYFGHMVWVALLSPNRRLGGICADQIGRLLAGDWPAILFFSG